MTQHFLTIPQLAKLLGVSYAAAYAHVDRGHVPAIRFGNVWVIANSDAEHFIKNRRPAGRPKKAAAQ